ncbi:MAG: YbgC/FadM family acyl-CoA thioesterase [Woeseiaceae bacterium]|nr:YbgC/FadM family acyl-CoA thioesterase [Woeseiaceae bacterium]
MTDSADIFEWPLRVYYEDTDAQGVVYYANYFRFLERARTEWLRSLGVDQRELMAVERRIFVVTKTEAEFLASARFNDELIVTARLDGLSRATFTIGQDIYVKDEARTHCVRSTVVAAYLDADNHRPKRVPPDFFSPS